MTVRLVLLFFELGEKRLNVFAAGIKPQRGAILFGGFGALALRLVETSEPFAGFRVRGPITAVGSGGQVGLQIDFGIRQIGAGKNSLRAPIESEPWIL